eukprot:3455553-Pyramimonas_sp.AAC.4
MGCGGDTMGCGVDTMGCGVDTMGCGGDTMWPAGGNPLQFPPCGGLRAARRDQDHLQLLQPLPHVRGARFRWTNQTQAARVYSHDGPIRRNRRGYILMMDQSDAGSTGTFYLLQVAPLERAIRSYACSYPYGSNPVLLSPALHSATHVEPTQAFRNTF